MLRETITMWKHTKMVVLVAITAAVYAGLMIPFKGIQFIPGFAELRPASAIPITFGILFGPAAAWGSAIGNIIGDFMGTLGMGSIPGAIGNFFFSLVCYKLIPHDLLKNITDAKKFSLLSILKVEGVVIVSSATVAFIIAWGLEILRLLPFGFFAPLVFLNNVVTSFVLVPVLLFILYPRVEKWDLLWKDILDEKDYSTLKTANIGKTLIVIGAVVGIIAGVMVSLGFYDVQMFHFQEGGGNFGVILTVLPFLLLFILGCFLA
ncbi:QueT transporter family protein [bacterium]|nr:QueT transporter family protein [bacterium]